MHTYTLYVVLYLLSCSALNNLYYCRHCGCPVCVCVCLFVYSFLPPRASTPRNIGAYVFTSTRKTLYSYYAAINVTPHPPLYGDRWGIGGDLTHRMCQIPHPSITIQCQIPTLYIHTRICAGTRANACAGQKPHPWGVISWRIPYQAPPLSPTGGGWGVTLIGALQS